MTDRIAHQGLAARRMDAGSAAALIIHGMTVGMSGFTGSGTSWSSWGSRWPRW